jgi:predicted DNA-binding transcriptional regulator AlpA
MSHDKPTRVNMSNDEPTNGARGRTSEPILDGTYLRRRIEGVMGELARLLADLDGLPVAVEAGEPMITDRLLTVGQVAERLGLSPGYVYKQSRYWNFTRKLGPKALRFSEAGLERWMNSEHAVHKCGRKGG